jgi:hypothetical protein
MAIMSRRVRVCVLVAVEYINSGITCSGRTRRERIRLPIKIDRPG